MANNIRLFKDPDNPDGDHIHPDTYAARHEMSFSSARRRLLAFAAGREYQEHRGPARTWMDPNTGEPTSIGKFAKENDLTMAKSVEVLVKFQLEGVKK